MFRALHSLPARAIFQDARRRIVSEALKANTLWDARLQNPVFKIFSIKDLNIQIAQKLTNKTSISILDYDVLINRIQEMDVTTLEFLENSVIKEFNKTQEALHRHLMTSHACVRGYMNLHEELRLVSLLKEKFTYGVFLDPVSAFLLLDRLIDNQNWSSGAEVAFDLMRSEEFSLPLTNLLALKACMAYWKTDQWMPSTKRDDDEDEADEYILQKFIRNSHYDDHFLIDEPRLLLGKTLHRIGLVLSPVADAATESLDTRAVAITCQILGLALYEKFDQLVQLCEKLQKTAMDVPLPVDLRNTVLALFENATRLPEGETRQRGEVPRFSEQEITHFKEAFQKFQFTTEEVEIASSVDHYVHRHLPAVEQGVVDLMKQMYESFTQQRQTLIDEQRKIYLKHKVVTNAKVKLRQLLEEEEELTYKDNEKQILYDSWLAPRTGPEKRISSKEITSKDMENVHTDKKRTLAKLGVMEE